RKRLITIQVVLQRVANTRQVIGDMLGAVENAPLCIGLLPRVAHLVRNLATVAPPCAVFIGPISGMADVEMTSVRARPPPIGQHLVWSRCMTKWKINLRIDVINPAFFQPLQRVGIKLPVSTETR